jgi:mono/diheme cytochrome c family protein
MRLRGWNGLAPAAAALIGALALACGSDQEPAGGAAPAASTTAPAAVKPAEPAAPPAASPAPGGSDAERQAGQIFATRCATCHGPEGRGDGPGAAGLDPKPRNYHDATWQASVRDEHLAKIIVQGGGAVGRSPLMPPNPDLVGKPDVVAALVKQIRSLAKP